MKKVINQQYGFTLIELMVAMTIGLLLLGGVITILSSSHQTYRVNDALSRLQENARYAFQLLSRDIRMAGYLGCVGDGVPIVNTLNNPSDFLWKLGQPIEGFEASSSSAWTPALPSPSGTIPSPLGGRDIVVIRGVDGTDVKVIQHPGGNPPGSADLKVTVGSGLQEDDIVLVTDCLAAAVFQVTNVNTSAGQDNVVHNTGNPTANTPGNLTKALGKEFTGGELIKISTRSYFIRMNSNPTPFPSLYRKVGAGNAEELVEGVEDMQIEYGEDLDGNSTADVYRTADAVTNWAEVVSVRISLLMQSLENNVATDAQTYTFNGTITTPNDRRLRQVFTTVVTLRNRTS
ncbi:MAG TPA: PilW family protein [Nitrosomonas sp.]|nr:PilW family protein [Nitrosomonas sp.]HMW19571.1 PilW family protein [Nitrosomonas sp.]HMW68072.1 PilW family protein [Nitrosomonas sp.]HMY90240.1 PilW family protein [Nitrosomonas sp.]HNA69824.1 PilW family protein [Nitrosomonas sp.]